MTVFNAVLLMWKIRTPVQWVCLGGSARGMGEEGGWRMGLSGHDDGAGVYPLELP